MSPRPLPLSPPLGDHGLSHHASRAGPPSREFFLCFLAVDDIFTLLAPHQSSLQVCPPLALLDSLRPTRISRRAADNDARKPAQATVLLVGVVICTVLPRDGWNLEGGPLGCRGCLLPIARLLACRISYAMTVKGYEPIAKPHCRFFLTLAAS